MAMVVGLMWFCVFLAFRGRNGLVFWAHILKPYTGRSESIQILYLMHRSGLLFL